jgi:hypothetical protein
MLETNQTSVAVAVFAEEANGGCWLSVFKARVSSTGGPLGGSGKLVAVAFSRGGGAGKLVAVAFSRGGGVAFSRGGGATFSKGGGNKAGEGREVVGHDVVDVDDGPAEASVGATSATIRTRTGLRRLRFVASWDVAEGRVGGKSGGGPEGRQGAVEEVEGAVHLKSQYALSLRAASWIAIGLAVSGSRVSVSDPRTTSIKYKA